jgi:hypothetical protein
MIKVTHDVVARARLEAALSPPAAADWGQLRPAGLPTTPALTDAGTSTRGTTLSREDPP